MARQRGSVDERENAVERLREFIRLNYLTGNRVARRIGIRDTTIYSWLSGNSTPRDTKRITAFLDSMPAEHGKGIAQSGYEYRESRIGGGFRIMRIVGDLFLDTQMFPAWFYVSKFLTEAQLAAVIQRQRC